MTWAELEKSFNRAVLLSFSKKKMMLAFPALILCGILIVFCRALAYEASDWVAMSLAFLPILLSSGILLALGVLLIRLHDHEVKRHVVNMETLLAGSFDVILGTSYLSIPSVLAYLCLWILMGIFFLFKEIPMIGEFFSVVFAFFPFLLIFSSICLCLFNLGLLFFASPVCALHPLKTFSLTRRVLGILQNHLFSSLVLFFVALAPIALVVGLLSLAALLTNGSFLIAERSLSVAFEWFFIMIPFCALLTPAVIFFFNFAAESHLLLMPKVQPTGPKAPFPFGANASSGAEKR